MEIKRSLESCFENEKHLIHVVDSRDVSRSIVGPCRSQIATDLCSAMLNGYYTRGAGTSDKEIMAKAMMDIPYVAVLMTDELIKQLTKESSDED